MPRFVHTSTPVIALSDDYTVTYQQNNKLTGGLHVPRLRITLYSKRESAPARESGNTTQQQEQVTSKETNFSTDTVRFPLPNWIIRKKDVDVVALLSSSYSLIS